LIPFQFINASSQRHLPVSTEPSHASYGPLDEEPRHRSSTDAWPPSVEYPSPRKGRARTHQVGFIPLTTICIPTLLLEIREQRRIFEKGFKGAAEEAQASSCALPKISSCVPPLADSCASALRRRNSVLQYSFRFLSTQSIKHVLITYTLVNFAQLRYLVRQTQCTGFAQRLELETCSASQHVTVSFQRTGFAQP
jgi:hypothetical protein